MKSSHSRLDREGLRATLWSPSARSSVSFAASETMEYTAEAPSVNPRTITTSIRRRHAVDMR